MATACPRCGSTDPAVRLYPCNWDDAYDQPTPWHDRPTDQPLPPNMNSAVYYGTWRAP